MNQLYASCSGISGITEIRLSEDYAQATARLEITAVSTTFAINDSIVLDMGYNSAHGTVFTGFVKAIRKNLPAFTITVEAHDVLIRAADNFLASDDPNNPISYTNTLAENVVGDLLSRSSVSNYTGSASSFTFGVDGPIKVNLMTAMDMISQINELLAFTTYADENGNVFFKSRPPRPAPAEPSSFTFSTGAQNLLTSEYDKSTDNLRNRVVVYGDTTNNVHAVASAVSPYLPTNFYQTAAIASQYIQTNAQAQDTANFNLSLLNYLTENARVRTLGNYLHHVRKVATLDESFTTLSGDWLIVSMQSSWSRNGYLSDIVLSR